jgi:hypothetical protein
MLRANSWIAAALIGVIVALLIVGVVSNTPLRHVVQVAPGVVVLGLHLAGREWARFAALAIFALWLLAMTLIWLFLLGIAKVITGHFTPVEVALTVIIGVAAALGMIAVARSRSPARWPARLAAFLVGALAQIGAMWLSLQPMFVNR